MVAPEVVAGSPLFRGIAKEHLRAIQSQASQHGYGQGNWIFRQGERAKKIFLLMDGRVSISLITPDGLEVLLAFITSGSIFGFNALVEDHNYVVSARAAHDSRVLCWTGATIRQLIRKYPELALNIFDITNEFLTDIETRYGYLATRPVRQRIAAALGELARRVGARSDDELVITVHQNEIAQLAGTTVYSVNRVLNDWQRRGIVKKGRGRIVILDMDALLKDKRTA